MEFNNKKGVSSIIKVVGVGGGGNNALQHMYEKGIHGVDFVVLNTDAQTLDKHSVSNKVQLGITTTEGLGAGADPEVGRKAAMESIDEIKNALGHNTKMVFITAGMGGGTGTGAAPVVAKVAKDMGILTVGIVTVPFDFEGKRRNEQAQVGLEELKQNVDSLIIINNDKVAEQYPDLDYDEAFSKADEVLTNAAKGMSEVITAPFKVNIDFRDAKTVLENSGTALMSIGSASGENRAEEAVKKALDSPLLNDNKITGAKKAMLLILSGEEHKAKMSEIKYISKYIQEEAGGDNQADVIWGVGTEEGLGEAIKVLVVATGFAPENQKNTADKKEEPRVIHKLNDEVSSQSVSSGVSFNQHKKDSSTPQNSIAEKQVFRLDDYEAPKNQNDFPTNSFAQTETNSAVKTLEEKPLFFEPEREQLVREYDLFSYSEEDSVSFTFDFEEEKEETNFSFKPQNTQVLKEEKPIEFKLHSVSEETPEEVITTPEAKEEEPIRFKKETIVEETPKIEEFTEKKEEFTIIEKKKEENPIVLERRNKLKEFNSRFQVEADELEIFEKIPAFKRKNMNLDLGNISERVVGNYLSEDKGRMQLRENKFLNKDVD